MADKPKQMQLDTSSFSFPSEGGIRVHVCASGPIPLVGQQTQQPHAELPTQFPYLSWQKVALEQLVQILQADIRP
jgi:hypothetical protein